MTIEREEAQNSLTTQTIEIDTYISFFFPFAISGYADDRSSPMQGIWGGEGERSKRKAWVINQNVPVQIDIWGGPTQDGKAYVFENHMLFTNYHYRNQRLKVEFTGIPTKDTSDVTKDFDVNCWYEFVNNGAIK